MFENPSQDRNRKPQYPLSNKRWFGNRPYGLRQYNPQTGKQFCNWTPRVDHPGYHPFNNNRQRYQYGNCIENEYGLEYSDVNNVAAINTQSRH